MGAGLKFVFLGLGPGWGWLVGGERGCEGSKAPSATTGPSDDEAPKGGGCPSVSLQEGTSFKEVLQTSHGTTSTSVNSVPRDLLFPPQLPRGSQKETGS